MFITSRGELENRLDAYYYKDSFKDLNITISKSKNKKVLFSEVIKKITNGFTFRDYQEEGTPYLKVGNIRQGYLDFSNIQYIDLDFNELNKKIQLKKGDILLTRKGTFGYAYAVEEDNDCVISSEVFLINLNSTVGIDSKYLEIFLNSKIGQLQFDRIKIGAIMGSLSQEAINEMTIIVPKLKEQKNIIAQYERAFNNKIKNEEDALNIIKNVDEIISQKIGFEFPKVEVKNTFNINVLEFENRLDPHFYLPNFKALLDNIRRIKNARLEELVEFSKETWNQKDGFENEFPYIEISEIDLSSGKINNISFVPINEAPSRAKMVVRKNDIIVSTTRPQRGAISLIDKDKDGFIASTGFAILRNLKTNDISKEYLFYILRTQICLLQMLQRSSGGSYPAITAEELKNIYIPIPDKKIQQTIVDDIKAFIDRAEALKEEANAEFENAKQEIESLILN